MALLLDIITRSYRTSAKSAVMLTSFLHEVIIGCMLGDLHAEKPSVNHNTRLTFKQGGSNIIYIHHLYDLFSYYCGTEPVALSGTGGLPHMAGKLYRSLKFNTLSLPCFNTYRTLFYNGEGTKQIPVNLSDHFTAVSLAY